MDSLCMQTLLKTKSNIIIITTLASRSGDISIEPEADGSHVGPSYVMDGCA